MILRGAEDSADLEYLAFNITSAENQGDKLQFTIIAEFPSYISIGSKPDLLDIEIVNSEFFTSTESGAKIEAGYKIQFTLPKMMQSEIFGINLEEA